MKRAIFIAVLPLTVCMMAVGGHPCDARGAGLKTTFVRVSLDNLRIGGTYNIREMANLPLAVYNTGDAPVALRVEPTAPVAGETREGYEPIPDPAWISFSQDTFEGIEPNRAAIADVVISIPDDQQYLGKRYQVMIWSHTVGDGFVACGLKSEVLFTTSSTRTEPPKTMGLFPTDIIIPDVEAGKPFAVTLEVFNPSDREKTVIIKPIPVGQSPLRITEGYLECPYAGILELGADTIVVPGGGHRSVEATVRFPEDGRGRGKSYMFAVAAAEVGSDAPAIYSAVHVTVK